MTNSLSRKNIELYSFLLILIGALVLGFLIIKPYVNALLAASVAAITFGPVYERILKVVRKQQSLASLLTILLVIVVIIGPLVFIGQQIFEEVRGLYAQLDNRSSASVIAEVEKIITTHFGNSIPFDSKAIHQFIQNILASFSSQAGNIFSSVVLLVVKLAIGIFALYYFLKDGDDIRQYIIKVSPLAENHTKQIIDKLQLTIQATIRGSIIVATIQAILIGIGLLVIGVSNPFLWGLLGFIAALVPALGTTLVTVPIILYLFLSGQTTQSIIFLIWGIGVVGLVDNLIRPHLLGRHIGLHPFLVFISVIGALSFFGPMGILWGPIILSLLAITLESYPIIVGEK